MKRKRMLEIYNETVKKEDEKTAIFSEFYHRLKESREKRKKSKSTVSQTTT